MIHATSPASGSGRRRRRYLELRYKDLRQPPVTLWEWRAARKRLLAQGRREVDAAARFEAVEAQRRLIAEAAQKTRAARRTAERTTQAGITRRGGNPAKPGRRTAALLSASTTANRRDPGGGGVVMSTATAQLDLGHLRPAARRHALEDDDTRIRRIRADRFVPFNRAVEALALFEELLTYPKRTCMPNCLVHADAGMGKTMLAEKFRRDHPAGFDEATGVTTSPVSTFRCRPRPMRGDSTPSCWPQSGRPLIRARRLPAKKRSS